VGRSKAPTVVYTCSHAVMQQLWFIEIWLFMEIRPGTFSTSDLIFIFSSTKFQLLVCAGLY